MRAHRGARLQPDVRDDRRPGEGRRARPPTCAPRPPRASSSTSRTSCSSRARSRRSASRRSASRSATRSRPATSSSARASSSRWRWSSSSRPPRRRAGTTTGRQRALRLVRARSASAPTTCGCASTTPTSSATTRRGTADVEYLFPIGWSELEGIANRGDFDLDASTPSSRARSSSTSTSRRGERYVPHVIEPAAGADRATLAFLVDAYDEEEVEGETRTVLRLHPRLAPVKVAVLPLCARTASPRSPARSYAALRKRGMQAEYDEGGSIGKRYRRQDEIGTPWCVTVDHQTLEDTHRDAPRPRLARPGARRASTSCRRRLERRGSPRPGARRSSTDGDNWLSSQSAGNAPAHGAATIPAGDASRSTTKTCTRAGRRATGARSRSTSARTGSTGTSA